MTPDASQRCPICATPVRIPQAAAKFRCPFCTTTLYVEYGFDGVTLRKEKPPLPVAPPPSEFEQLLAKAQAPRPAFWQVWRRLLFGFQGRLGRSSYWVGFALGVPAYFLADYVVRLAASVTPNPWAPGAGVVELDTAGLWPMAMAGGVHQALSRP